MNAKIENGTLTLTIPIINPPQLSATGKTFVVASTRGNKETEAKVNGQPVIVGLNAYIYAQPKR